ncbi:WG repeat-containing protein [Dysgonomonas sp. 520]|uniref:WG repeat-containing protein n=1 Tax=Dysgonomonas sp. 520 TaxID=2302931 RepID=UPI0013D7BEF4|nr:WG repeat-containing protein [Dysgonomonas sp. 520]
MLRFFNSIEMIRKILPLFVLFAFSAIVYPQQSDNNNTDYKSGLYDKKGKLILPCQYEDAELLPNKLFRVKMNGKWGLIDSKNNPLLPCQYEIVRYYTHNLIVVGNDDRNRVIDINTKKEIIPPVYEYIGSVSHGFSVVCKNKKWGTINITGQEILPCEYGYIETFRNGYSLAMDTANYKWGIINYEGKVIVPFKYTEIRDMEDLNISIVKMGSLAGMVRPSDGKEIVPCEFNELYPPENDLIRAIKHGKWGAYHITGQEIIPFKYNYIDNFKEDYARSMINQKWGVLSKNGSEVLPFNYSYISGVSDGMAIARKDKSSNWGAIDIKTKNETVPFEYLKIEPFKKGYTVARDGGFWGAINRDGKKISQFIYSQMNAFSKDGLALALKDSVCGAINHKGKEVVPFIYQTIHPYSNKAAVAKINDKYVVINTKGKIISKEYDRMETPTSSDIRKIDFVNNIVVAFKDGKKGIVNNKGKEIVPCIYDDIKINENGTYSVKQALLSQ